MQMKASLRALVLPLALIAGALTFLPSGVNASNTPTDSITLTSPDNVTIAESDDYATQVLARPWDMSGPDEISFPDNYSAPVVENGLWTATCGTCSQASVQLQYQNFSNVYSYLGEKDGVNYPVDTHRFTHLRFRANIQQSGNTVAWFFPAHIYTPSGNSNITPMQAGWHIYDIDLNAGGSGGSGNWSSLNTVSGIRLDAPQNTSNNQVQYDWIRLTPDTGARVVINWTYSSSGNPDVTLTLGTSSDPSADEMTIATVPASQGSYTWTGAALAPGTYYIHAHMNGASSSSGPLNVGSAPVVRIDAPSPASGEDFAAANLGTLWDGNNPGQFERTDNITNQSFSGGCYQASATNGDPQLWWLIDDTGHQIDTSRYRFLNVNLLIAPPATAPNARLQAGTRVYYSTAQGQPDGTFAILAHYNVMMPIVFDLPNTPLDQQGGTGWSGQKATFRFDPHESDENGTPAYFRICGAHLSSLPTSRTGSSRGGGTLIRWATLQGSAGSTADLFYDNDRNPSNGMTQIASNVSGGGYSWDTSSVASGSYYIYIHAHNGTNESSQYSLVPIVVGNGSPSTIFADVPNNNPFVDYINDVALRGVVSGYYQADNTVDFRPAANSTRAQLSKMVVLAFGLPINTNGGPHFSDVPTDNVFYNYIETLFNAGIISGFADGTFKPGNNVTRGQTAKIVAGAGVQKYGWQLLDPENPSFNDVPRGSTYYTFVETAVAHGVISGYPGPVFLPGNNVTRGQLSKMLSLATSAPLAAKK